MNAVSGDLPYCCAPNLKSDDQRCLSCPRRRLRPPIIRGKNRPVRAAEPITMLRPPKTIG